MTANIVGFVTRAQAGLQPPRSVSHNIDASRGGLAVHWGGPAQRVRSHSDCFARWRAWQNYHMNNRNWADIAYNFAFCDHGYVFAGRGFGVRSAANGTNDANYRYNAAVWLGGQGEKPTQLALNALDWLIVESRDLGAGREVRPHKTFTGSQCPGPDLITFANSRHNKNVGRKEDWETLTRYIRFDDGPRKFRLVRAASLWDFGHDTHANMKSVKEYAKDEVLTLVGRTSGHPSGSTYVMFHSHFGSADTTRKPKNAWGFNVTDLDPVREDGDPEPPPPGTMFSDVPEGHVHKGTIEWVAQEGLLLGRADGTFNPSGSLTRAQIATVIKRLVDYLD